MDDYTEDPANVTRAQNPVRASTLASRRNWDHVVQCGARRHAAPRRRRQEPLAARHPRRHAGDLGRDLERREPSVHTVQPLIPQGFSL